MAGAAEKVGVFGGTFDPPHIGHLVAASEVRFALGLDRVLMVVANDPWHKAPGHEATPATDRLAMVEAAVASLEGLEASDVEIRRGGPSYTIDTLVELREGGLSELFLIVGADAAAGLAGWRRASELPSLAELVLVDREGTLPARDPDGWPSRRVRVPRLDVSSTDLRRRFRTGAPVDLLVPRGAVEIARRRGLYG